MTISIPAFGDTTSAIQKAIDDCFQCGGGTVVIESGLHKIRGIRLRSHVSLLLKSGAELIASRDPNDYHTLASDKIEPMPEGFSKPNLIWTPPEKRIDASFITDAGSRWNNAIIRIQDAEDIAIIGEAGSVIDGCNSFDPIGEGHMRGVHGITAFNSKDLRFSGFTMRHIGNWAFRIAWCQNLSFESITVLAGHDGIHVRGCDNIKIKACTLHTGDDAIAGFDNQNVEITRCDLNTACSAFRFGGTDVVIEECNAWGPGIYPIRQSLPRAVLEAGENGADNAGRRNMLSFYTYFSDFTQSVREQPGDIVIRRCKCKNVDRLLHYNFSGNELWQRNRPLSDICLEKIEAKDIGMSLCAYGDKDLPTSLKMQRCHISFRTPQKEFLRAAHLKGLYLKDIEIRGVDGPLVRSWSEGISLSAENVSGADIKIETASSKFETASI